MLSKDQDIHGNESMKERKIKLLICDLDNTLYDWVAFFVPSFYAMVDKAVEIADCDKEKLLDDFRKVHQIHHDSEHPFSLLETDTIRQLYPRYNRRRLAEILDPALHAYNSTRKNTLKLHHGVEQALDYLSRRNIKLVAHTESKLYAVVDRLRRFDLHQRFTRIYCRERSLSNHPFPEYSRKWLEGFPMEKVVELSKHQTKPNVDVLLEICSKEGFKPSQCAYIGDSMARDMLMAKNAGVFAVWAAYGAQHNPEQYERLVRISHWTEEDVQRELRLRKAAKSIQPDFIARDSFADVVKIICSDETIKLRSFTNFAGQ